VEAALGPGSVMIYNIAVIGQLAARDLPLSDQFEPGAVKMVGF
jgi:hypothetical protein